MNFHHNPTVHLLDHTHTKCALLTLKIILLRVKIVLEWTFSVLILSLQIIISVIVDN